MEVAHHQIMMTVLLVLLESIEVIFHLKIKHVHVSLIITMLELLLAVLVMILGLNIIFLYYLVLLVMDRIMMIA